MQGCDLSWQNQGDIHIIQRMLPLMLPLIASNRCRLCIGIRLLSSVTGGSMFYFCFCFSGIRLLISVAGGSMFHFCFCFSFCSLLPVNFSVCSL